MKCKICNKELTNEEISSLRELRALGAHGNNWCSECSMKEDIADAMNLYKDWLRNG